MDLITAVHNKGLVVDGAMSTALEKLGVNTQNNLWTAIALVNDLEKVYQVHWDYFQAGAQLTITNTYQANVQGFLKAGYSQQQAQQFIAQAVQIAKQARSDYEKKTGRHNFVAGTIGSYGAYLADGSEYRGDYHLTTQELLDFHLPRLQVILKQEPDCLAIETQPQLFETQTLLNWMQNNNSTLPIYVSFTLRDPQTLSDGTTLAQAIKVINQYPQVFAVGVNCIAPAWVLPAVQQIHLQTTKEIIVYPNSGSSYDPQSKSWQPLSEKIDFYNLAKTWYHAGAHLIGGCCTTGVKEIQAIAQAFEEL